MEYGLLLAVVGAVLAIVVPSIGSIMGTNIAGQTAAGVVSENPDLFGKVLLLEALMSSQAVYGFLTCILIMQKAGLVGGEAIVVSNVAGIGLLLAALPVTITAMLSAIAQGKIAAGGMGVVAKHPGASGKAVILAAMAETFAVFGLLASILLIQGIKL